MFLFVANGKRPSNYRVILVLLGQFINLAELPRQFRYDKVKLIWWNLGRIFNFRFQDACLKTAKLKVEKIGLNNFLFISC
jgi:hypothetical protein